MGDKTAYPLAIDAGATSKGHMGKYGVGGISPAFALTNREAVCHGHPMVKLDDSSDGAPT